MNGESLTSLCPFVTATEQQVEISQFISDFRYPLLFLPSSSHDSASSGHSSNSPRSIPGQSSGLLYVSPTFWYSSIGIRCNGLIIYVRRRHCKYKWVHSNMLELKFHSFSSVPKFGSVSIDNGNRNGNLHVWDDANIMIDHTFDINKRPRDVGFVPNPVPIHFHELVYSFDQKLDEEIKINILQLFWDTRVPSCANPTTPRIDATTLTTIFLFTHELHTLWDIRHSPQYFGGFCTWITSMGTNFRSRVMHNHGTIVCCELMMNRCQD